VPRGIPLSRSLAHSFRTGTGRYDPVAKPSANDRLLRTTAIDHRPTMAPEFLFSGARVSSKNSPCFRAFLLPLTVCADSHSHA